jgi:hypothetical protein
MSDPINLIDDLASKEAIVSVVNEIPIISTALASNPFSFTNYSLQRIAQAAPSEVGQHYSLVKG